ncbi:UDP-glucose--hexose-1-phosphate uridylyltransferase [Mangrovibacillus cuniculi]|uniref:Galactose-1-phosphate uridylyltransferase n=1 Tax=Mangrovibacillus cuniculi TaxID=2593652 RepID=A0A7S8C966_9BACI|nr:UDP-glucose--hexose-1-phosphate uridylyltransferase [Mangrovibacillus cuniculi]QPC45538.1 UDP-glucose--hexose-1-phosphate uridylyltransferase [Mangrovibacillus cuniculi]
MNTVIFSHVENLLTYGVRTNLIEETDKDYVRNRLLAVLDVEHYEVPTEIEEESNHLVILESILDWAYEHERLEHNDVTHRDILDTEIMGCFVARPSEVNRVFRTLYEQESPTAATDYLYRLSNDSNYIRTGRIAKNQHWLTNTDYGDIEITINLSKPEKDPATIALEKQAKQYAYPTCLLCKENVGYKGRLTHPARSNLRTVPLTLQEEKWQLQYSPYVYYNEHAIVFREEHTPMKISKQSFAKLLDFVEQYPHYFIGSNADLPIVGGSILSHDHFQAGNHEFPMAKAGVSHTFTLDEYKDISIGIVDWPMSVLRLTGTDAASLVEASGYILEMWKDYSDPAVDIEAFTGDTPHNTITPIARRRGDQFELDLVLRNNRTSEQHPLGIFHPHAEVHPIKKENIGLIEVMGLAVLPGRLKEELQKITEYVSENQLAQVAQDPLTAKHAEWVQQLVNSVEEVSDWQEVIQQEVGRLFSIVLEHAGVFKRDKEGLEAFIRFTKELQQVGDQHEVRNV